ncbi:MAG: F0F1 ATP synthase subunit delta [bacterium]|nr:F0F1 ATP synthase subunit delta [bacterium]
MTENTFVALCQLIGTKDRMISFITSLDEIIINQSQSPILALGDDLFTHDEFVFIKNLVKDYNDLKALRKQVFEVPVFSLQIPIIPTNQFTKKILSQLQAKIAEPFFLSITTNPGIIGGCIIEYRGMYTDNSLKRSINQWQKGVQRNGR